MNNLRLRYLPAMFPVKVELSPFLRLRPLLRCISRPLSRPCKNKAVDKFHVESAATVPVPVQESGGKKQPPAASVATISASNEQGRQVAASPPAKGTSEAKIQDACFHISAKKTASEQPSTVVSLPPSKTIGVSQSKVPAENKGNKAAEPDASSLQVKTATEPSSPLSNPVEWVLFLGLSVEMTTRL